MVRQMELEDRIARLEQELEAIRSRNLRVEGDNELAGRSNLYSYDVIRTGRAEVLTGVQSKSSATLLA